MRGGPEEATSGCKARSQSFPFLPCLIKRPGEPTAVMFMPRSGSCSSEGMMVCVFPVASPAWVTCAVVTW